MNSHISKKQIPLLIPDMPNAEQLLPFLKQIDETRSYSNEGPLVQTLEARIADYFEVDRRLICVVTNATLGLLVWQIRLWLVVGELRS